MSKKLIKNRCEIETCDVTDSALLQLHHIIERTEENTSNHPYNLAILCANHHVALHTGKLRIIGVYPATKPPNHRVLVYEIDGVRNIDIEDPYVTFRNESYDIFGSK